MPTGISCPFCSRLHSWPPLQSTERKLALFNCPCGATCHVFSDREEGLGRIFGPDEETSVLAGKTMVVFQREVDVFHDPVMNTEVPIHLVWTRPEKPHE
jgi:hypothetical protein